MINMTIIMLLIGLLRLFNDQTVNKMLRIIFGIISVLNKCFFLLFSMRKGPYPIFSTIPAIMLSSY